MHSTIQQVHRLTNKIRKALEDKHYCPAVYLDVAKAFDKVWHEGLLYKIKSLLPYNYFRLLRSYLEGRKFLVRINDDTSTLREIKAGVPQGSVLGPILYLIFTNDLPTPSSPRSVIATFADDTVIMSADESLGTAINTLQTSIDETTNWFNKWGIKINESKTIGVIYTNKRKRENSATLTINGEPIKIEKDAKYLGINIDEKLTWKKHIIKIKKQLQHKTRQLYWLIGPKSTLSLPNKILIYKAAIKPIWTYGLQIWGTTCNSNLEIIERQQSKMLRLMTNAPRYISNKQLLNDLKINTVKDTIKEQTTKYLTKITQHTNIEINKLPDMERNMARRLNKKRTIDLVT